MNDLNLLRGEYIFLSYSSKNEEQARDVLNSLEKNGNKCFFAPRDIKPGQGYAGEIIRAIERCSTVVLIMTQAAVDSVQVLREINAAVSRGKLVVPLKFEDVELSDDMKYYLGVSQWVEVEGEDYDDEVAEINNQISNIQIVENPIINEELSGVHMIEVEALLEKGYTPEQIAMRELEIDYLSIPSERYTITEEYEGTLEDWVYALKHSEYETTACLVKDGNIIGYTEIYPLKEDSYNELISGESIIRDNMIDIYCFGGEYPAYISLVGLIPDEESQANYLKLFDWLFEHISYWRSKHIYLTKIGISVYSDMVEAFVEKLGFTFAGLNPVKGKIYEVMYEDLINSDAVRYRYGKLDLGRK
jgi:hypothetical protein